MTPEVQNAIMRAAAGRLDPSIAMSFARIESGGDPRAKTGSYHGLFQLSDDEFRRYGGGDIYNPDDNARAFVAKTVAEIADYERRTGRKPDASDLYMSHQQGIGGEAAHRARPDAPAWENMLSTGEGRQKGAGWAKQAIWGNLPDEAKARFGSVENVSSQAFTDYWRDRVAKMSGQPTQAVARAAASPTASPTPSPAAPQSAPGLLDEALPDDLKAVFASSGEETAPSTGDHVPGMQASASAVSEAEAMNRAAIARMLQLSRRGGAIRRA